jgi:hypothetical protein
MLSFLTIPKGAVPRVQKPACVQERWHKATVFFLLVTTVLRLALCGLYGLKVEESYYWNYAQHPDLGYFDHPPMVAWLIGLSCRLGGNHPFFVRLPAVLLFAGTSYFLYRLVKSMFNTYVGFITVVILQVIPAFWMHSVVILPDSPLLFFWTLGLYAGWKLVSSENPNWWWAMGVITGLGLDSKYPALLIPLGVFLFCFTRRSRRLWLCPQMFGAACLAIALFSPVLLWNVQHDFASFRFQGLQRFQEAVSTRERIGSWIFQLALLSPFVFFLLYFSVFWGWQRRADERFFYLLMWCIPFLSLMAVVSCVRLVQLNWPLPGYVSAAALMALAYASETRPWRRRLLIGLVGGLGLFMEVAIYAGLILPLPAFNRVDDLDQWDAFGQHALQIVAAMPHPQRTFLAGHGYQAASELALTTGMPHLVSSNNVLGQQALSFDAWEDPAQWRGWDCLYCNYAQITSSGAWRERVKLDVQALREHFSKVDEPVKVEIERGGKPLRLYLYYRCYDYRGPVVKP